MLLRATTKSLSHLPKKAEIEWLTHGYAVVRVFSENMQYQDPYEFVVFMRRKRGAAVFFGAMRAPLTSEWRAIRMVLQAEEIRALYWKRYRKDGTVSHRFINI